MSLKVFDLVPVVQKFDNNLKYSQIECFCYSNTILYIGTNDGHILRYSINRSNYMGENIGIKSELIDYILVNQRKPINLITIISKLRKIIYLSDGNLNQSNFEDLQPSNAYNSLKIKNVTTYCYNENYTNDISILCVCVRGKTLQLYSIKENDVNFYKEISLPGICIQMEMNQNFICIACDNSYQILNILNSNIQTLFSYDIEQLNPYITTYSEGEFLLNCQGDLGMFATFDGQTTRPPVTWSSNTNQFQISNPYVLCLCDGSSIKIYNLIDSKLKQEVNNIGMVRLLKYIQEEKFLLVSTNNQIVALNPLSINLQCEQLLAIKRVDEALKLFECSRNNLTSEVYQLQFYRLKTKAAFVELFENDDYDKCFNLLVDENIDYKQIVNLIPDLFKFETDLNEFDYVKEKYLNEKNMNNNNNILKFKNLLINLMLKLRNTTKNDEYVYILFKLCIETRSDLINSLDLIQNLPIKYCLQHLNVLKQANRHHSCAIILNLANQYEEAFEIWKSLVDTKLSDEYFPGFDYFIERLSKCKDHQLVWKYVDWSMNLNQSKAVEIFTKRLTDELSSERMRPDIIIDNLNKYKIALMIYLDYLVNVKNIKKEKYVTQLISIHLENIIDLLKMSNEKKNSDQEWQLNLNRARENFQTILENSVNFKAQAVLARLKEHENVLLKECAILYGKIDEHEKALKILVYNLEDYEAARNYCLKNSNDSIKLRRNLFNILFSIYFNQTYKEKEKLLKPTIELLNSKMIIYFDAAKVLDMIPNNWSMRLSGEFLQNILKNNLSRKRNYLAEKNIANSYKFYLQNVLFNLKKEQLYIDEDSQCQKCLKTFDSTVLVRQPNGKLSHTSCKVETKKT